MFLTTLGQPCLALGRLLEAMIESLDEFYSANLGEEVTRGMRENARRGFYVASYAPYGYRKVKVKDGGLEFSLLYTMVELGGFEPPTF